MKLNVFIGWSGRASYLVARKLKVWLEEVVPNVETWMSEQLPRGSHFWFNDLTHKLRQADFAVICVNPENWENPWVSYEPGVVVGKTEKETRVCPYLIDLSSKRRNLPEPLKYFLAEMASEEGTYRLVKDIHDAAGKPLSEQRLTRNFNRKWPELEKIIEQVAPPPPPPTPPEPLDYMDDFMKVSRCIELHQDRLYGRLRDVIEKGIQAVRAGRYDHETVVEMALKAIRRSKERFVAEPSLLVGNVCEFFERYYTEDELRRVITEMESGHKLDSKPSKPRTVEEIEPAREAWIAHMKISVAEIFSEYHKILLGKLNTCLRSNESSNTKDDKS
ncbi:MAG: hypothetical protein WCF57_02975 [Pyrinomonadaceae bacterium]